MPHYVRMQDHKLPDGTFDLDGYLAALRANGEACQLCDAFLADAVGEPRTCGQCAAAGDPGPLRHDKMVRCPACGRLFPPECDFPVDDRTWERCPACGGEFGAEVHVRYSYVSPARPEAGGPQERTDDH